MNKEALYLNIIKKKILDSTGLDCNSYKDDFLERRISIRLAAHGTDNYKDYLNVLERNKREYITLMDTISVDVSRFFRDKDVFDTLKENILPKILKRKRKKKNKILTVWSAGCDTGEEPYSVAILLHEILQSELSNFFIQIYGTDISEERIKRAKKAKYAATKFQEMDPSYVNKYFYYSGGLFKLKDNVKKLVKFEKEDLVSGKRHNFVDLIICRNVLIYFTKKIQEKVLVDFYNCLNSDGYLMLGKSETLIGKSKYKFKFLDDADRIYRKNSIVLENKI